MTITFPRDLPEPHNMRQVRFEPVYSQVRAPTRGGLVQVANVGADLWSARYETAPLRETEAETWKAWLHSLRGGARLFRMWNPLRRYALGYASGYGGLSRSGGGSFDGTANLSAIGGSRDTVTINTLPASFVLAAGDLVSFPLGAGHQSLHRVIEGGTASVGGSLTVTVEPTVPLGATTSSTVDLVKPWCYGVLDPRTVSGPWQVGRVASVSFEAMQVY